MGRRVLALFAKAPLPGLVKTRLVPALSREQAAALYEAMLLDVLELHARRPPAELSLWYAPAEAERWFRAHAPPGYALHAQLGADLAARMAHAFRCEAARGFDRIVLRGTDSPTLPEARVLEAFEALERTDAAICPDRDGGYNLIALRAPCDALFALPMSDASVLERTLGCARSAGLAVELLDPHYDVDVVADLAALQRDPLLAAAPRTAHWLAGFASRGRESAQ
jgi:rSAM/selenodomain-associated transferase 1